MNKRKIIGLGVLLGGISIPSTVTAGSSKVGDNALQRAGDSISYAVEAQSSFTSSNSPLWLNANRYGLSSVDGNNGYLRAGIFRHAHNDTQHKWRLSYGLDLAVSYNFTNTFTVQQLYADIDYKKVRFSMGSKERPMALKNQKLSSGGQTFGINARPIPEFRFEMPDYISITGKSNWVGVKGHFGYGFMTDGKWQEGYVNPGEKYAKKALYHSKAGYLRIGNEKKFPLVFEGGIEMACQFGGDIYNPIGFEGVYGKKLEMGHSFKDFFHAIYGGGSDATDEDYENSIGNTVGSWLMSLSYKGTDWSVRAYYDHYFEDHSQMFWEYGWFDGLVGLEINLPKNRFVSTLVVEHLKTTDQTGPIYHDHTESIPDQISGADDYYNHNLYQGWQHWGQAIGNPLFHSPLYKKDGTLNFTGNRFTAHHVGIMGHPTSRLSYRLLYSYMENWGTYDAPYLDKKYSSSFLGEINYDFNRIGKVNLKGWSLNAAFGFDRGSELGKNTGGQITLRKTGLLIK